MTYEHCRKYIDINAIETYVSIDAENTELFGKIVKAMSLSNVDYKQRYQKLNKSRAMKRPPSCGRIFSGYLVVRKYGSSKMYETWMPNHVFEELYKLEKGSK